MVIGHSIIIDGHKTTVSLEEVYWKGLHERSLKSAGRP
jgi:predicted DNA-binding ribbon-helix-helix protein